MAFCSDGVGSIKISGVILDFEVAILDPIKATLFGTRVHTSIFLADLDVNSKLLGHRDPVNLLVVLLGDCIVFGPQVLGVGHNLMQIGGRRHYNG